MKTERAFLLPLLLAAVAGGCNGGDGGGSTLPGSGGGRGGRGTGGDVGAGAGGDVGAGTSGTGGDVGTGGAGTLGTGGTGGTGGAGGSTPPATNDAGAAARDAGRDVTDTAPPTTGPAVRPGNGGSVVATGTVDVGNGCRIPTPVGFKENIQAFLITACGGGNGCHVVDTSNNHAYDWITDYSHCPDMRPRFQVAAALVTTAHPASCSNARFMPPPDATGAGLRVPLTACQIATLQAWLAEPLVDQIHNRNNAQYPMPPYN
jgi:hypothetical protein